MIYVLSFLTNEFISLKILFLGVSLNSLEYKTICELTRFYFCTLYLYLHFLMFETLNIKCIH